MAAARAVEGIGNADTGRISSFAFAATASGVATLAPAATATGSPASRAALAQAGLLVGDALRACAAPYVASIGFFPAGLGRFAAEALALPLLLAHHPNEAGHPSRRRDRSSIGARGVSGGGGGGSDGGAGTSRSFSSCVAAEGDESSAEAERVALADDLAPLLQLSDAQATALGGEVAATREHVLQVRADAS
jgi:hypothetical protein